MNDAAEVVAEVRPCPVRPAMAWSFLPGRSRLARPRGARMRGFWLPHALDMQVPRTRHDACCLMSAGGDDHAYRTVGDDGCGARERALRDLDRERANREPERCEVHPARRAGESR